MLTRIPDYFDDFHCLAGSCPDTCCGQWEIVVDPEAKARYLSVDGELGNRIRAALTTVDGEDCMVLENGRCPLLTEDGLCPIVQQLGEEFLSTTCHTHPRFTEIYGGLQETMLSVSCPEAARLLLTRQEPLTFLTRSDNTLPEPTDLDPQLFQSLLAGRETAFSILQNRTYPLTDRLALLLCFSARLEDQLNHAGRIQRFCDLYRNPHYQTRLLRRIRRYRLPGTRASMEPLRSLLLSMEHLGAEFAPLIANMSYIRPEGIALEQLAVYFIFRWWLKAACNGALWRQTAAAVVSVVTAAAMTAALGDVQQAARLYSKEIEHSDDNLALLRRAMELPHFSLRQLLGLLEVP